MKPPFRTWAEIDLGALTHNLRVLRDHLGAHPQIIAIVKADAYGHGAVEVSRAIQDRVSWLAVATLQEAAQLQSASLRTPVMVLSPILTFEAQAAVELGATVLVDNLEIASALSKEAQAQNKRLSVHLKIDTGMKRFGITPSSALSLAQALAQLPGLKLEGVCSHFAASDSDPEFSRVQLSLFTQTVQSIESALGRSVVKHMANSNGLVSLCDSHLDAVRPGLALYGLLPCALGLRPALSWKTRITSLREARKNETVGYGRTFKAKRPTLVATLGIGYADGYLRTLSNKGIAQVNGQEVPLIGRICMDQMMLDASEAGAVQVGDEVTLVGDSIPAHRLSRLADTTVHEITTQLGERVHKIYLPAER